MRPISRLSLVPAALLALALQPMAAQALDEGDFDYNSTEDLYQVCSAEGDSAGAVQAQLACRAFIEATVQYHDAVSDRKKMKRLICYPGTATIEDARRAFVAWAGRHKDDAGLMGEMPVVGLVRALAESNPCTK